MIRLALFGQPRPVWNYLKSERFGDQIPLQRRRSALFLARAPASAALKKASTVRSHRAAELNYRRAAHAEPGMEKFFSVGAAGLD